MVLACSALFGGQAPFAVGCRHGGTISPTSPRLLLEWLQACAGIRLGLSYYTPQLASTQAVALLLDVTPILSRPTPSSSRHCCLSTTSPARRVLLSVPLAVHYHPLAFWYAMCVDCRRLRTRRISPCPKRITASTPSGVIVRDPDRKRTEAGHATTSGGRVCVTTTRRVAPGQSRVTTRRLNHGRQLHRGR